MPSASYCFALRIKRSDGGIFGINHESSLHISGVKARLAKGGEPGEGEGWVEWRISHGRIFFKNIPSII